MDIVKKMNQSVLYLLLSCNISLLTELYIYKGIQSQIW